MFKRYTKINFDDAYVSLGMDSKCNNISKSKEIDKVLEKSILNQPLEKLRVLPEVAKAKKKKKEDVVPEVPEEVLNDVKVLQMRSVFDTKRFYKKNDTKNLSSRVQVGKVLDSPADFYHSRLPRKMRKPTLVDELLADDQFKSQVKKRYVKIIKEKRTRFRREYRKQQKRYNRKTKKN